MSDRNISYAQNGEDIVLWRALHSIDNGIYLDVGANDPTVMSVTRKFYDAGWHGIAIEPNPEYAQQFRAERPRDIVIEAVASDLDAPSVEFHLIEGSGLSTLIDDISSEHAEAGWTVRDITVPVISLTKAIEDAGLAERDLHFLSIDTEGAEAQVLASLDFTRYRPWILIVEATAPLSTRQVHGAWQSVVEKAGYTFQMFDGLSRFYVANERLEQLGDSVSYSAGVLDEYVEIGHVELEREFDRTRSELEVQALRALELSGLYDDQVETNRALIAQLSAASADAAQLGKLVSDLQQTLSWRITKPLRGVKKLARRS
ncbi:FkbM family methyltransferase [Subtercola lobariae]|uniref:DNA-binding protein n=1 Tax=Subtercola lobariae TaxID=1588641 RepID=A0A917B1A2_9MICO|nr:FkbM family methyltransferase [Subtercola lobariae]GGF14258.1 DNA-binding protein [Subtercola lobariae]